MLVPCKECITFAVCVGKSSIYCSILFNLLAEEYISNGYELMDYRASISKKTIKKVLPNMTTLSGTEKSSPMNIKLGFLTFSFYEESDETNAV